MGDESKPVLLSGIQPSGNLTIGNYIGALRHWVKLQDEYDCFFPLVDLHAITKKQNPSEFRERCYDFIALYIASGIDPDENTLFVQSHVPAHTQLAWILNCITPIGELSRMTQFKDKASKNENNVNAGLLNYPILMAADILLYGTDIVPVGADQKQHLELTRRIARRFNKRYGETFKVPNSFIPPTGARIMSLRDPSSKMSKTDSDPRSYIALLDSPDEISKKIRKAPIGTEATFEESNPSIWNLMTIYSSLTNQSMKEIGEKYSEFGQFKQDLTEIIVDVLQKIQRKYKDVRENLNLERILVQGAEKAISRSEPMIQKVYDKIGFIPP